MLSRRVTDRFQKIMRKERLFLQSGKQANKRKPNPLFGSYPAANVYIERDRNAHWIVSDSDTPVSQQSNDDRRLQRHLTSIYFQCNKGGKENFDNWNEKAGRMKGESRKLAAVSDFQSLHEAFIEKISHYISFFNFTKCYKNSWSWL